MKRYLGLVYKGAGMGAADAVPGVSGGTIAFITGIYEELIQTIERFGPGAVGIWKREGSAGLVEYLNLRFLLPLLAGIGLSLVSVAHIVVWLMEAQPRLLDGFFFGLVGASALVVWRRPSTWRWWYLLPLAVGLVLAQALPALMPLVSQLGSPRLVLVLAGFIAISALLLPGVSGSLLLLTMGLYGTVMEGIRSADMALLAVFGLGCLAGLMVFSRVLGWLLRHGHDATMQLLVGFILGSLPALWPWRQMTAYQMGPDEQAIPLDYQYLAPGEYSVVTGEPSQWPLVVPLMLLGAVLVLSVDRFTAGSPTSNEDERDSVDKDKEDGSNA
ncbi:DUF368 domain-containing protein [Halomonas sp. 18H]|uniref:DUF368 domain-containing protein n=1 Tax=Halomonas almeriensis TaxID=308163 RepID=UPI002232BF3B|nr:MULTISPECIES: DUF368 domain-containing protein [Halomonas]MCW4149581.1 DUF368 domain-containing protein [Halomonas sp. 18H]MDN3553473.1 DUF368 domain-containing protein [Halomonas almeriensis]